MVNGDCFVFKRTFKGANKIIVENFISYTQVGEKSLRNAEAGLHEVPFKLTPEGEASTVLSSSLCLFLQYSGWRGGLILELIR